MAMDPLHSEHGSSLHGVCVAMDPLHGEYGSSLHSLHGVCAAMDPLHGVCVVTEPLHRVYVANEEGGHGSGQSSAPDSLGLAVEELGLDTLDLWRADPQLLASLPPMSHCRHPLKTFQEAPFLPLSQACVPATPASSVSKQARYLQPQAPSVPRYW